MAGKVAGTGARIAQELGGRTAGHAARHCARQVTWPRCRKRAEPAAPPPGLTSRKFCNWPCGRPLCDACAWPCSGAWECSGRAGAGTCAGPSAGAGRAPAIGCDTLGGVNTGLRHIGARCIRARYVWSRRPAHRRASVRPCLHQPPPRYTAASAATHRAPPPPPPPRPRRHRRGPADRQTAKRHIADKTTSSKENRFMTSPRV